MAERARTARQAADADSTPARGSASAAGTRAPVRNAAGQRTQQKASTQALPPRATEQQPPARITATRRATGSARPKEETGSTTAAAAVEGATMAKTAEPKTATKASPGKARGSRSAADTEAIRTALSARRDELKEEYDSTLAEITELQRDRLTDSAEGDDQADTGTKTFEREQEISLANNILERINQVERALERLDEGSYGWCERCGNPIPVERLAAFPSATLCVSCKQLEERR
jgi:RNA polymerase-binding protein DksA